MTSTTHWNLQECGFSPAIFSAPENAVPSSTGEVRILHSFDGRQPPSVTVCSSWDSCYILLEADDLCSLVRGRWKGSIQKLKKKLITGEKVAQIFDVGKKVIFKTSTKRMFCLSNNDETTELKFDSASILHVHVVGEEQYVLLEGGTLHVSDIAATEFVIGDPYPLKWEVKEVACGSDHILLLESGMGRVWSRGLNHRGQLGHGDICQRMEPTLIEALDGLKMQSISCGLWHNLVLSDCGDLYSWGWNAHKQLGHSSSSTTVTIPSLVALDEGIVFCSVDCGNRHSAALTKDGKLWTWGWNGHSQLGHSEERNISLVPLPGGTVVSWMQCGPWSTTFLTSSTH